MRDKNLTYIQFNLELNDFIKSRLSKSTIKKLTTAVAVNPTRETERIIEERIQYPRTFKELEGLMIVVYFISEELFWRIFLDLEEMNKNHINEKQKLLCSIYLSDRENCIKYLYFSERFSGNELFGNILTTGIKTFNNLRTKTESTKIIPKVFRRGYNDKGSRSPDWKLGKPKFDWSFTQNQNEKERKQYLRNKTKDRILLTLRTLKG